MPVYQNIIAAVDLGDTSAMVLQHASALAQECEARLTVLHVVNYSPLPNPGQMMATVDDQESKLIEEANRQVQQLLEREALSHGVGAIVCAGRPKVEIHNVAKREKADLLVVGAHGRHGLAGLLGSTTNRVLEQASCDVLVVR